ncbi:inovirus-type Gp2 protein [Marinomonas rhizomae]|uniref:YagK/YfjJ domain-containing protein n=1 Tax=Marinomonas rhizomae TaxID=491948 RepID=UPI0021FDC992|nr:inovirus-type Gp2 protein [Marinomonas rhizomae]
MLSHHCKVLVYRLDMSTYDYSPSNKELSDFIKRYRQRLQRSLGLKRVAYLWCREQNKSDKQHYHLAFIVDANKHQRPSLLIEIAKIYWNDMDIGTIHTPKNCYRVLKRNDSKTYQLVFERLCYLAKVFSKGKKSPTTNDYEGSRIKPKDLSLSA